MSLRRWHWSQRLGLGLDLHCEPEEVVLESNVGVGPGSPCEPELVVVDMGTWLASRVSDGLGSV